MCTTRAPRKFTRRGGRGGCYEDGCQVSTGSEA